MWLKIEKIGLTPIKFYLVAVLLVAALWGYWKYAIYSGPAVYSQAPLSEPLPDDGQSVSAAPPAANAPQTQSPAASPAIGTGQNQFPSTPPPPSEWQKLSVTVEGNTGALLTTLATAMFGAVGWLVFEARKTSKKRHMWAGYLAALCTAVSLFFGAASQGHLVTMLSSENFNPYDPVYTRLNAAQFWFLGAAACFLAVFAFYDLSQGD